MSGFLVVQNGSESILLRFTSKFFNFTKKATKSGQRFDFELLEKFSRGLHNISAVLAYVFRINPIHRNKNYDHPTHITIFIVRNVSRGRFLVVESESEQI